MTFRNMLEHKWNQGRFVCVGLDPDYERIPQEFKVDDPHLNVYHFLQQVIDATYHSAGCFKPQFSFFEALGPEGMQVLADTVAYIRSKDASIPIIADAKRGDIGSTNKGYVQSIFGRYGFDAVTVHPYLGHEAMKPFLECKDKGIIVLCKTSNKGSAEFQNLEVDGLPFYHRVAYSVATNWNTHGNCMLVVGATYPNELKQVRKIVGDMTLLIPGIGAQGGDLEKTIRNGKNKKKRGMIINSSRGIIFAKDPSAAATELNSHIAKLVA